MSDNICNTALAKIAAKYEQGMKEHGGNGLEHAPDDLILWLNNLQEELIDGVMYIEKLLQDDACPSRKPEKIS